MAKVKKYIVTITFQEPDGEICSITQNMADYSIGSWCRYFISEGYTIIGIKIPELEPQNKISEVSIDHN